jgi:hypothetical protein
MDKRIYKFRAWNPETKTMVDLQKLTPLAVEPGLTGLFLPFDGNLELMQFTGLLDKNGKEIYEGDILSGKSSTGREKRWQMKWSEYGRWEAYPDNEYNINWKGWEVIGNIYENPELLK